MKINSLFNTALNQFLNHIESIRDSLPMTMLLLKPFHEKAYQDYQNFIKDNTHEFKTEDNQKAVLIKYEEKPLFDRLKKNNSTSRIAQKIIPESLFVSLISQFDAYLGNTLRDIFVINPEILNNSEKTLTYSKLIDFKSLEEARSYIIEKEIESILRKSHAEHFDYLENILGIPLRKNLNIWSKFIEITERRNLLVHCDGLVSGQYLATCRKHGYDVDSKLHNTQLRVLPEYFYSTYRCLFEIAVKLTHTIWRKLLKEDLEEADKHLNTICFDLIVNKDYKLADIILDFAFSQKKHFNDSTKNMFIVNMALSKYLQGEKELAKEIINKKDWSASDYSFKLAYYVICEEDEKVYSIMDKIGKDGDVSREEYMVWPLFSGYHGKDEFKKRFKKIFDEEYSVIDIPNALPELIVKQSVKEDGDQTKNDTIVSPIKKPSKKSNRIPAKPAATQRKITNK